MTLQRRIACAAFLVALFGARAHAVDPPCGIGNHYILDPLKCLPPGPISQTPGWEATGSLNEARQLHSATLLPDGRVLVAGGRGDSGRVLDSAELYDPVTGVWSATPPMSRPRAGHTATLLADGRLLVTGGTTSTVPPDFGRTDTAELFDPAKGTWTFAEKMSTARDGHAAVRLQDGKVLIAGGANVAQSDFGPVINILASAEIYDPVTGRWTPTGKLNAARYGHSMTTLLDGHVLAAKGTDDGDLVTTLSSAELYDPATGAWSKLPDSGWGSVLHTATLLLTGKVLFTSGNGGGVGGDTVYISSELFDPETKSWTPMPNLLQNRYQHAAVLLESGATLIIGGAAQAGHFPSLAFITRPAVEWFDPATSGWKPAAELTVPRVGHSATLLMDGRVLVAGGSTIGGPTYSTAEVLKYQLATPPQTTIEYRDLQDFPGSPGGHFFYTDDALEIAQLDAEAPGRFERTGRRFKSTGAKPLCRFYGSLQPGPNAHFFTISDDECAQLRSLQRTPAPTDVQQWNYEGLAFLEDPPTIDAAGIASCPAGTSPIYRAYNNALTVSGVRNAWDSVHRYTPNKADVDELVRLFGWRDEGIAFCSRQ